jgi:hypothetical protein
MLKFIAPNAGFGARSRDVRGNPLTQH